MTETQTFRADLKLTGNAKSDAHAIAVVLFQLAGEAGSAADYTQTITFDGDVMSVIWETSPFRLIRNAAA